MTNVHANRRGVMPALATLSFALSFPLSLALSVTSITPSRAAPGDVPAAAQGANPDAAILHPIPPHPSARELEGWRREMSRRPRPKTGPGAGCYEGTFPDTAWKEVPCTTPPHRPYPPRAGS